jgi:hypothetical protein
MPRFGPISRRRLISYFRRLGFTGPYRGTRHEFMAKGELEVRLPNPHGDDIGRDLLAEILRQAGITREEWERL